jgi:hypothetical protein
MNLDDGNVSSETSRQILRWPWNKGRGFGVASQLEFLSAEDLGILETDGSTVQKGIWSHFPRD